MCGGRVVVGQVWSLVWYLRPWIAPQAVTVQSMYSVVQPMHDALSLLNVVP